MGAAALQLAGWFPVRVTSRHATRKPAPVRCDIGLNVAKSGFKLKPLALRKVHFWFHCVHGLDEPPVSLLLSGVSIVVDLSWRCDVGS